MLGSFTLHLLEETPTANNFGRFRFINLILKHSGIALFSSPSLLYLNVATNLE